MKVLVYFKTKKGQQEFEASRLAQNIRNGLELSGVQISRNMFPNDYQLIHLLRPGDENNILITERNQNIPLIYSVLSCEHDIGTSMLLKKSEQPSLTKRALSALAKADGIIVSNKKAKDLLTKYGEISAPIYIASLGVNVARFDYNKEVELQIFPKYFQMEKPAKMVLTLGDYTKGEGIETLDRISREFPNIFFLFLGKKSRWFSLSSKTRKLVKKAPKNLQYSSLVPGDVYRSTMLNTDVLFVPRPGMLGDITIIDAMASKTQIVIGRDAIEDESLINDRTALIGDDFDDFKKLIGTYCRNLMKTTVRTAYEEISKQSLDILGLELKGIYEDILRKKVKKNDRSTKSEK